MRGIRTLLLAIVACGVLLWQDGAGAQSQLNRAVAVEAGADNTDSIAVIIGNKNYREPGVVAVEYAHNDAEAMKSWLINAMGFRETNIIFVQDATYAYFRRIFGSDDERGGDLLKKVKRDRSNVFVYYSGHGAPDLRVSSVGDRPAYLIPTDISPERASEGYSRDTLMRGLDAVREAIGPTRWVVVMLEACFSGNSAGGAIVRTSGNFAPKALDAMNGITRVSAARRDQVANWDEKLKLGLLTGRFLLAASGELDERDNVPKNNGVISWSSIAAYAEQEVRTISRTTFKRDQDPEIDRSDITVRPFIVPQISAEIGTLKDETAWRKIQDINTKQGFQDYIAQCSKTRDSPCKYKAVALQRASDLGVAEDFARDGKLWDEARLDRNYERYLDQCSRQKTGCYYRPSADEEIRRSGTRQSNAPAPEPPPASVDRDTKLWESAKSIDTVPAYEAYLAQFPSGFFSAMAKAALERVKPREPSPSREPTPQREARLPDSSSSPSSSPTSPSTPMGTSFHFVSGLDPNGWNWLALRSAPNPNASWSKTVQLGPDTPLKVFERSGDYHRVQLRSGESGWVAAKFVDCCRNEPERASYSYVANLCLTCSDPTLALRSSAGSQSSVDYKIKSGALLTVISQTGSWYRVRTQGGETGWAESRYVGCCR